jgi:hypothetical protein
MEGFDGEKFNPDRRQLGEMKKGESILAGNLGLSKLPADEFG